MRLALLAALALACNAGDEPSDTIADSTGELAPEAFWLPLACGATSRVGQGNDDDFSHHDELRFAFDLLLARGSPVHAMADGVVTHVKNEVRPGDPCRDGGDDRCRDHANLVVLRHDDGTSTLYKHLDDALATVGNRVARGALLGRSGATGWSTTPHLHVMRMTACAAIECPSIALAFVDVPGDGVPVTGQDLKSMNCPE